MGPKVLVVFQGIPAPQRTTQWYAHHGMAWSKYTHPATTLWFWNRGWVGQLHPLLTQEGWE